MKLIEMAPGDVHTAVRDNLPVVMAAGVVEYHGPHLPIGTDILIATSIVEAIAQRCSCVVAPALPLGPTGRWAGGARDGEWHIAAETFFTYSRATFRGLLDMGFRRIYVVQHHQGPEGVQSLCLRRAASELALEDGHRGGDGWGRTIDGHEMAVFSRIAILPADAYLPRDETPIPWGHAGFGETSYIAGVFPQLTNLQRLTEAPDVQWLHGAERADAALGRRWFERCVETWVQALTNRD